MAQRDMMKNPWLIVAGVVAVYALSVVALAAALLIVRAMPTSFGRDGYYAVFLNNGQVYFGKIGKETEQEVDLTDIYYLKLSKPALTQEDLQSQSDASLVKLGNELHGPEDKMEISRSQVMFVEKLRKDGKVAQAIDQYRSQGATK